MNEGRGRQSTDDVNIEEEVVVGIREFWLEGGELILSAGAADHGVAALGQLLS